MIINDKSGRFAESDAARVLGAFSQKFAKSRSVVAFELLPTDSEKYSGIIAVTVTDRYALSTVEALADGSLFALSIGGESLDFLVRVNVGSAPRLLVSGQAHLPVPPSGPVHGGDPIWHPDNGWGSIAFSSQQLTLSDHGGNTLVIDNALLSCNHILAMLDTANFGDPIANYRDTRRGELAYFWPVTDSAVDPIDIAVSKVDGLSAHVPLEIRGLGPLKGIGSAQYGDRLLKCGARTSLTAAIDDGIIAIRIAEYADRIVIVRKTTTNFADVGDSGSAVLNKKRELVGIVIAGQATPTGIVTYYLPTFKIGSGAGPTLFIELGFQ